MGRTQVYLGTRELELLERAASASGASRSELIRRAIRSTFGEGTTSERVAAIRRTSGLWKDRKFTGATYVDGLRGDLNHRLSRLGLE